MRKIKYDGLTVVMIGAWSLGAAALVHEVYNSKKDMRDAKEVVSVSGFQNEDSSVRPRLGTPSVFYGFDTNKDGTIDLIKERWTWYGSRGAAPMCSVFHKEERGFEEAKQLMDKYGVIK